MQDIPEADHGELCRDDFESLFEAESKLPTRQLKPELGAEIPRRSFYRRYGREIVGGVVGAVLTLLGAAILLAAGAE